MEYNKEIAVKLYEKYKLDLGKYKHIAEYFKGNTDAKKNYPQTDRSNNFETYNFIKKFTIEEVSFMVGNPITYISAEGNIESIKNIENIINQQKGSLDSELCQAMLTYGHAYEMYYLDEGQLKIRVVNPLNSIAYCNVEDEVELFLYIYMKELDDNVYIDIFDDSYIYKCDENFNVLETIPHYFKCCPVSKAELMNGINDTLYSEIKELQDSYEINQSTYCNEIQDTRLAYLGLYGASIDDEDATKMKEMGIIQLPIANSKAEYIIKNIDPNFIQGHISELEDKMYQISQHINHNIGMVSNLSGTALENRLIALRNKITTNQKCLTSVLKKRIKCIFTYLNISENANYNYNDISIKYTMNVPSNDTEMADIISKLSNKMSIKTGLRQLSFVTNADKEFDDMMQEQRILMDFMGDLDNLKEVDVNETE
ncbi:phage portal protein [Clostridium culturomicium]|uniref:phage portal protein n=1 Tax=Clostridium culturomicium TaxID=1499683 RepID=UPI0006948AA9|nr:phage portal protein [Clostridium culturomicium]